MKGRLLAVVAAFVLVVVMAPAHAGRNCEARPPDAFNVQRSLELAERAAKALDATGAQVVVLARSGQDLSKYRLRWSHLGLAYRDGQSWKVVHKLIMDHRIFAAPMLGKLFRLSKAIPIAPQKEDPAAYERAFAQARKVLDEGDLLCIFPEGGLTKDGALGEFKGGVMKVLQTNPVPVIPMALSNLWGSFFSRVEEGTAMVKPFRRGLYSRVGLDVGEALPAAEVTPAGLRQRVQGLLDQRALKG